MDLILNTTEKLALDHFCEFIKTLTPKEQEEMISFIQGAKFGRQLDLQRLEPTGT